MSWTSGDDAPEIAERLQRIDAALSARPLSLHALEMAIGDIGSLAEAHKDPAFGELLGRAQALREAQSAASGAADEVYASTYEDTSGGLVDDDLRQAYADVLAGAGHSDLVARADGGDAAGFADLDTGFTNPARGDAGTGGATSFSEHAVGGMGAGFPGDQTGVPGGPADRGIEAPAPGSPGAADEGGGEGGGGHGGLLPPEPPSGPPSGPSDEGPNGPSSQPGTDGVLPEPPDTGPGIDLIGLLTGEEAAKRGGVLAEMKQAGVKGPVTEEYRRIIARTRGVLLHLALNPEDRAEQEERELANRLYAAFDAMEVIQYSDGDEVLREAIEKRRGQDRRKTDANAKGKASEALGEMASLRFLTAMTGVNWLGWMAQQPGFVPGETWSILTDHPKHYLFIGGRSPRAGQQNAQKNRQVNILYLDKETGMVIVIEAKGNGGTLGESALCAQIRNIFGFSDGEKAPQPSRAYLQQKAYEMAVRSDDPETKQAGRILRRAIRQERFLYFGYCARTVKRKHLSTHLQFFTTTRSKCLKTVREYSLIKKLFKGDSNEAF